MQIKSIESMESKLIGVIGENAGIVWRFLNASSSEKFSFEQLKKGTKLKNDELYAAIGWLARENKIQIEENGSKASYSAIEFYF